MKRIFPLFLIIIVTVSACKKVERIHSLSQLEPALRKNIGNPSQIDTVYKSEYITTGGILFQFKNAPNISFSNLVSFLSKAYDSEPVIKTEDRGQYANLVPILDGSGSYMIKVIEWYGSDDNKRHLDISVVDVNNELVIPFSPTPLTAVPSK